MGFCLIWSENLFEVTQIIFKFVQFDNKIWKVALFNQMFEGKKT